MQGNRIETPEYITDNKLIIDYKHYITNQIMKPLLQLFSLVLWDIPFPFGEKMKERYKIKFYNEIEKIKQLDIKNEKKQEKIQKLKEDLVKKYIFNF